MIYRVIIIVKPLTEAENFKEAYEKAGLILAEVQKVNPHCFIDQVYDVEGSGK